MTHDDKGRELAACPFCGSATAPTRCHNEDGYVSVICDASAGGCGCEGRQEMSEVTATKAWNRRATVSTAQPVAQVTPWNQRKRDGTARDDQRAMEDEIRELRAMLNAAPAQTVSTAPSEKMPTKEEIVRWIDESDALPAALATESITLTPIQIAYVAGKIALRLAQRIKATAPSEAEIPAPVSAESHPTVQFGEKLFTFNTFNEWVNKAKDYFISYRITSFDTVCLDKKGRICAIGKHFMAARDEDAFPINVYRIRALQTAAPQDKESGK